MSRKALIGSVVLNVFLAASVLGLSYGWPLFLHVKQVLPKRERYVSFFDAFPVGPGDVVFVGDGITNEARWSELFVDLPVKNRGIDGDTSADVAMRIGQIAAGRPAKIFLLIGGGDAAAEKTVAETAAAYEQILDRIARDSPATQIFVQSILPRGEEARDDIRERNEAIEAVAAAKGAVWIDLVPAFVDDQGALRGDLSNDHVHLLAAGYRTWRDTIAGYVGDAPRRSPPG